MQAFVESEVTKDELLDSLRGHIKADRLVHGVYWSAGRGKGCAVGCTIRDFAPGNESSPSVYQRLFGIHRDIANLVDTVFESLDPPHDARWPVDFVEAINVGADVSCIQHGIAVWLLRDERSPFAKHRSLPWMEYAAGIAEARWMSGVNEHGSVIVNSLLPRPQDVAHDQQRALCAVKHILALDFPIYEILDESLGYTDYSDWVALANSIPEMLRTIKVSAGSKILSILGDIEQEKDVAIMYAVETGSRIWGMASEGSDYDVRFIYVHRMDHYLTIGQRRDVIDNLSLPFPWDVNGWDIRKALMLLHKMNVALLEWLFSPVVYRDWGDEIAMMRRIALEHYHIQQIIHHYYHMARRNYNEYLKDRDMVKRKKYLYVTRPLAIIRWMDQGLGAPPPADLNTIVDAVIEPGPTKSAITDMLVDKRAGAEWGITPRDPVLDSFCATELDNVALMLDRFKGVKRSRPSREQLDNVFVDLVRELDR